MTDFSGYPLAVAIELAQAEGYEVMVKELTCRKGSAGKDTRVIRVLSPAEGKLEFTCSSFTTELDCGREG